MDILNINKINKTYSTGSENLKILTDISFDLKKGENLVITGESGSGKSTLLNLIGGLDNPDSGEILSSGWKITDLPEKQLTEYRSKVIGLVFQFHFLLKEFTALENVMMPAFIAGVSKKEAEVKALELLDAVGLLKRKEHYPSQMSGGERQRAAVARALINDPDLVLADEPTGNLDYRNSKIVEDLLFSMVSKYGKTMIIVTHDMNIAERGMKHFHLETGEIKVI